MPKLTPIEFAVRDASLELFVDTENPGPFEQAQIEHRPIPEAAISPRRSSRRGHACRHRGKRREPAVPAAKSGSWVRPIALLRENRLRLHSGQQANGLDAMHVRECAVTPADGLVSYAGSEAWGHATEASDRPARCDAAHTARAVRGQGARIPVRHALRQIDVVGARRRRLEGRFSHNRAQSAAVSRSSRSSPPMSIGSTPRYQPALAIAATTLFAV